MCVCVCVAVDGGHEEFPRGNISKANIKKKIGKTVYTGTGAASGVSIVGLNIRIL